MKKDKKEVEYKEKAGTAWSHSYLNQKPWHPLSYPNQRRKWIAEQTHAQKEERRSEVAREFAQEQEFFRQTAQMSKKEKEKMEIMQAVSFMYMRPPGYNAEAARAAEIADERKRLGLTTTADVDATLDGGNISAGVPPKTKSRVKDVFGRTLPTEEEFPSLRNAPRHDTGAPTRVKPFAIEIRNVKCARCGAFGHQSGDRECPLKDVLMPSEEARLIREDPLNVIMAQTAADELSTWELKQKPGGLSPARGGFKPDDPNQQIIPDEDIYDEYGGFLPDGGADEGILSIPNLLASLSHEQRKELTDVNSEKKHKRKKQRKVKRKDKRLDTGKSANGGDHHSERDGQRDDRRSTSSEDEQRYKKPRTRGADKNQDDKKLRLRKDESSETIGDNHRSMKVVEKKGGSFHLNIQKSQRSKGTADHTHLKGDTRTDRDEKPCRLKDKDRRDIIVDERMRVRFKGKREISDAELRRHGNRSYDEPRRGGYKNRMDSNVDNQRRLGNKSCNNISDDEQRRFGHKKMKCSSDDEHKRLRQYYRSDSSDYKLRRVGQKDMAHSRDEEQGRLRQKHRRDSSDDEGDLDTRIGRKCSDGEDRGLSSQNR
ncbi:unnamed protein product [Calypogeia fissa]